MANKSYKQNKQVITYVDPGLKAEIVAAAERRLPTTSVSKLVAHIIAIGWITLNDPDLYAQALHKQTVQGGPPYA